MQHHLLHKCARVTALILRHVEAQYPHVKVDSRIKVGRKDLTSPSPDRRTTCLTHSVPAADRRCRDSGVSKETPHNCVRRSPRKTSAHAEKSKSRRIRIARLPWVSQIAELVYNGGTRAK
jgi:hypothetical protein